MAFFSAFATLNCVTELGSYLGTRNIYLIIWETWGSIPRSAQMLLLAVFRDECQGPYVVLGIELGLATGMVSALLSGLSL